MTLSRAFSHLCLFAVAVACNEAAAAANECLAPARRDTPISYTEHLLADGTFWFGRDLEEDYETNDCVFKRVGESEALATDITLHPADPAEYEETDSSGCGTQFRFGTDAAEVRPARPLVVGAQYEFICGARPADAPTSMLMTAIAPAPGPIDQPDVRPRKASTYEGACGVSYLRLHFPRFSDAFFSDGGLIWVEYSDSRLDLIRGVEQHDNESVAFVDLPLSDDVTIVLHGIDRHGDEFVAEDFDVSSVRQSGGGCALGSARFGWPTAFMLLSAVLLFRPRRARGA
jgi:hypothetical protein